MTVSCIIVLTADDGDEAEPGVNTDASLLMLGMPCMATSDSLGAVACNIISSSAASGTTSCDSDSAMMAVPSNGSQMMPFTETVSVPAGEI